MPHSLEISANGEVFTVAREITSKSVLWGEMFNDKERKFLRKNLTSTSLGVSAKDVCNIKVRMLRQPKAAGGGRHEPPAAEDQKTAVMLHAVTGDLTSSWTWVKLVAPLFERGFGTILMIDLPGFGRSAVKEDLYCPPSQWMSFDWAIVTMVMERLEIRNCCFVATGESCATVLRVMQHMPGAVGCNHIFHNPVISLEELFPKARGLRGNLTEELRHQQNREFERLLTGSRARLWATFDTTGSGPTMEAYDALMRAKRGTSGRFCVAVTAVTKQHICSVRAGSQLPDFLLFPCRYLRRTYADFLEGVIRYLPGESLPEDSIAHVPKSSTLRAGHEINGMWPIEETPAHGSLGADAGLQGVTASLTLSTAAPSPRRSASTVQGMAGSSSDVALPTLAPAGAQRTSGGMELAASRSEVALPTLALALEAPQRTSGSGNVLDEGPQGLESQPSVPQARRTASRAMAACVQEALRRAPPDPGHSRRQRLTQRYVDFNYNSSRPGTAVDRVDMYPVKDNPFENLTMDTLRERHARGSCWRRIEPM